MRSTRLAPTVVVTSLLVVTTSLSLARDRPRRIHPGQTLRGEMPAGDPYETAAAFELRSGDTQAVTVEARSLDFDTVLKLSRIDPVNPPALLRFDDNSGAGTNSRISLPVDASARYRIEIQSREFLFCGREFELSVVKGATELLGAEVKQAMDRAYWDAVEARAKALGRSECQARALMGRAANHYYWGEYEPARRLAKDAVELSERWFGTDHLIHASALHLAGSILAGLGLREEATPLLERALVLRQDQLGPEHPDVAETLVEQAVLTFGISRPKSEPMFERALAIQEARFGPEDPRMGRALAYLGFTKRATVICGKLLDLEQVEMADCLFNRAGALWFREGKDREAQPLYERALRIYEDRLGHEHPAVSSSLNMLAAVLDALGFSAEARPLYERSLAINDKRLDPNYPEYGAALQNYAAFLHHAGNYAESKALLERALEIAKDTVGPGDELVGFILDNMGNILRLMGSAVEARAFYERAIEVREKRPDRRRLLAYSLYHLAALLHEMGLEDEAMQQANRSLAIYATEEVEDLRLSHPLHTLGEIHRARGDFVQAREAFDRALAIREKQGNPPALAQTLRGLASIHMATGVPSEAMPLYARALELRRSSLGPDHPSVAESFEDIAALEFRAGHSQEAVDAALKAERISTEHLRLTARALAEDLALRYAATRVRGLDLALTLLARQDSPALASASSVYDALIRSRSVVLDELAARRRDISRVEDPETAGLTRTLVSATARLAALTVRGPGQDLERHRALMDEARRDRDRSEQALARASLKVRQALAASAAGLSEVIQSLPSGAALVSFVSYLSAEEHPMEEIPSYLAFVLKPADQVPSVVPLGPAAELDQAVERWRRAAGGDPGLMVAVGLRHEAAYREAGTILRQRAWDPVAAHLGSAKTVFVVPDGALHLVSFAALPTADSRYLIETGPLIHYLSAERDLIQSRAPAASSKGLLALGGPDYDETSMYSALAPRDKRPPAGSPLQLASVAAFRGERSSCGKFESVRFSALPASDLEAQEVVSLWRQAATASSGSADVTHLSGAGATEAAFKARAAGHRTLHLATHGFFMEGRCPSALDPTRGIGAAVVREDAPPPPVAGDNPLKLAGLALAGANHRASAGPDEDDGILTAEEIAAMDLSGVEWAVLSACDTGVGEVTAGEGVFGLRRAFQVAGAGTLIMSLWGVEDAATRRWMKVLYEARLLRGLSTAEAVREAGLAILRERRADGQSTHPFYWAGFVSAGDWR